MTSRSLRNVVCIYPSNDLCREVVLIVTEVLWTVQSRSHNVWRSTLLSQTDKHCPCITFYAKFQHIRNFWLRKNCSENLQTTTLFLHPQYKRHALFQVPVQLVSPRFQSVGQLPQSGRERWTIGVQISNESLSGVPLYIPTSRAAAAFLAEACSTHPGKFPL